MTDDVRKLLGGYATGTLTEDEKSFLFQAALNDDALFAALADEQVLKELLDDSAVRARLLQATEEPRFTVLGSLREWFESPKSKALVATGAVLLAVIGINQVRQTQNEANSQITAELRRPSTATQPTPAPPAPAATQAPVQNEPNLDITPGASTRQKRAAVSPGRGQDAANPGGPVQSAASPPPPPPTAPAEKALAAAESISVTGEQTGRIAGFGTASPGRGAAGEVGALQQRAPAPTAAAAPAGSFERAAGTTVTPLRYELLRRDAAGNFRAVPPDYLFVPGDVVRLRVSSTRHGAVGISGNTGDRTIAQTIGANTWTEVPLTGGIPITAQTAKLVVAFSPSESPTSRLLDANEAAAKRAGTPPVALEIPIRQKRP